MTKTYQMNDVAATELAVPEQVMLSMAEIAEDMHEGLLALAVGAGLQVMSTLMDANVTAICGPRGRHDRQRVAVRHGTGPGSVTLGGRRVPVTRPRVRAADGSGELAVPAYELFSSTEVLGRMAMERVLAGLSTRRYRVGLEPVGETVAGAAATSKSAVSRRFVAMTETALNELLAANLPELDLVALMVDGVHFAEHLCVVALGIGIDGGKHPLARQATMVLRGVPQTGRSPHPAARVQPLAMWNGYSQFVTSLALGAWKSERLIRLGQLASAHRHAAGSGPRRRHTTQAINWAMVMILSAELQGYFRDLHDEGTDFLAARIAGGNQAYLTLVRNSLIVHRGLESVNPKPQTLQEDFERLGIDLWTELERSVASGRRWHMQLDRLNRARNAIAHHNPVKLATLAREGYSVNFRTVNAWRSACDGVARYADKIVGRGLRRTTGVAPW